MSYPRTDPELVFFERYVHGFISDSGTIKPKSSVRHYPKYMLENRKTGSVVGQRFTDDCLSVTFRPSLSHVCEITAFTRPLRPEVDTENFPADAQRTCFGGSPTTVSRSRFVVVSTSFAGPYHRPDSGKNIIERATSPPQSDEFRSVFASIACIQTAHVGRISRNITSVGNQQSTTSYWSSITPLLYADDNRQFSVISLFAVCVCPLSKDAKIMLNSYDNVVLK